MSDDKNILPNNNSLNEEQLLGYINNTLTDEQRHALEMEMLENEFMNDAVEGLEKFENTEKIQNTVRELNHHIRRKTTKYKIKKSRHRLSIQQWVIIAIGIVLFLCVIAYWLIKKIEG